MQDWQKVQDYWNANVFLHAKEIIANLGLNISGHTLHQMGVRSPRKRGNQHYDRVISDIQNHWNDNPALSGRDIAALYGISLDMVRALFKSPKRYHTQKLTDQEASEIKRLCMLGRTQASVAREYGVSDTTVYQIKTGQTWANIK